MKYIATIQQKIKVEIDSDIAGLSEKKIVGQLVKEHIPYKSITGIGGFGKSGGYAGYTLETEDKVKVLGIKKVSRKKRR